MTNLENNNQDNTNNAKENVAVKETNNFEQVPPKFQEVPKTKKAVRTDSYFDGGVLELIGWKILAFLVTFITLGIAAPWAKCMLYSYQIGHTVYNGKRLRFEGTGGSLFVNTFKWIFFTIITLGIYAFVIPVKKTKWVISNIHFEDEDFIKGDSYFDGNTLQLIGVDLLSILLTIVSFGLLYPFTVCYKLKWINKHTVINRKKLSFTGSAISLWGHYILWYILLIVTFGIFGFWLPICALKWQTKRTHIKTVGEVEKKDKTMWIAIPLLIIAIMLGGFAISQVAENVDFSKFEEIRFEDINFVKTNKKVKRNYENITYTEKNSASKNEAKTVDSDGYTTYTDPSIDYSKYRQPYVASAGGVEDVLANTDIVCAPAIQEIPGEYIVDIKDGNYNTVQSDVTVTFSSNGTNLKYNSNNTIISYDPSSGYAWSAHNGEPETYDAYFTVLSNGKIKVEMNISKGNNFTNIIGYKK